MAKYQNKTKKGFTIIEVVLVLAIGGLIMLMVFLALPALQRSQRDTQRRNQLGEFTSQLVQYQTNNRGKVPKDLDELKDFMTDYLRWQSSADSGEFLDPDGESYIPIYECQIGDSTEGKCTDADQANKRRLANSADSLVFKDGKFGTPGVGDAFTEFDMSKNGGQFNHTIHYFKNARCDGEALVVGTGNRNVAITMRLENGWYCGTN